MTQIPRPICVHIGRQGGARQRIEGEVVGRGGQVGGVEVGREEGERCGVGRRNNMVMCLHQHVSVIIMTSSNYSAITPKAFLCCKGSIVLP